MDKSGNLAYRMRPQTLDEFVGQEDLLAPGKPLRTQIEHDELSSMLFWGPPGCGKTMLAMEFLVRGATQFNEPGVFMMFEESAGELAQNLRSLGVDLDQLQKQKKIAVDHVHLGERGIHGRCA